MPEPLLKLLELCLLALVWLFFLRVLRAVWTDVHSRRISNGLVLVGLDIGGTDVYAGLHVLAGALPKIEFDFLGGDIRPFAGFAAGVYTVVVLGGGTGGATAIAGTGFGVMPQLGINFGGFRIAGQYHAVLTGPGAAANAFPLELSGTFFGI